MLKNKSAKGDFVGTEQPKAKKEVKQSKKKDGKPGFFKRIGLKIKDVFSELKKVSWPKLPKIVKQTGVVLVVVIAFLIVITAFDYGLMNLLGLVSPRA